MKCSFQAVVIIGIFSVQLTVLCACDPPPAVETAIGNQVAELMEVGFERGAKPLANSERLYRDLKAAAPDDARIDFAYGLILWKQLKNKEAQAQFLAASKLSPTFRPAWRAFIWSCFLAKNDDVGYARLLEFAKTTASSENASQHASDADVSWIGSVMAALELTAETSQRREAWLRAEERLTDILGKDLMEVYLLGKADVHARHSLLENDILQAREKAKQQRAEQLERKQQRLQKSLDGVKEKRETLKKSAAEMKEVFTERVAEYQKKLERLEKDYELADRRSATLASSLAIIDQQLFVLNERRRGENNATINQINFAVTQIQNQRNICNAEFQRAIAAAEQISASAQQLTRVHAEVVEQYQHATGEIVEEDVNAERWKERTLKQAAQLKKANGKPTVPKNKIQLARSFRTYVDLDLNAERAGLLESFGLQMPGKGE